MKSTAGMIETTAIDGPISAEPAGGQRQVGATAGDSTALGRCVGNEFATGDQQTIVLSVQTATIVRG